MPDRPLGRRAPTDWAHVDRYPLIAALAPAAPTPVVIGVNWYVEFDRPERGADGAWWIARDGRLTRVRGGHCVCLEPAGARRDTDAWWRFYDQGAEGACVGFGLSRLSSLDNRKRYDGRWLWNRAKEIDEWPDTNPGDDNGTSVRAGLDVLRTLGHVAVRAGKDQPASVAEGIRENRWAASMEDVLAVLGTPGRGYVTVLNSWGPSWPHRVRMPVEVLDRLRREDGEIGVVTDR